MKMDTKILQRAFTAFFCSALMIFVVPVQEATAQRMITVDQGVGTLNEAIDSDTTATGERVDSSTVYVLSSGGTYLLDGSIEHRGYHLTIVAEDGWTERPRLIPAVDNGGESSRPFRPRGDLTIRGLYVTNEDELGGRNTRIIRISENEVNITVDNCHLDKDGQSAFRIDGTDVNLFLTNSIVSNIGTTSDYNNGRGVDDRGNQIDTLWLENNTFYNITSQIVRDDGGVIQYAYVNQNTVYNIAKNTPFEMGPTINGVFTNNMVYNAGFLGYDTTDSEEVDTLYVIALDELTTEEEAEFGTQSFTITNNNFHTSQAMMDAYPDTVAAPVVMDSVATSYVTAADAATNLNEAIAFENPPVESTNLVIPFWMDDDDPPPFDFEDPQNPFDFEYPSSAASFTGGTDGQQIGSLFWHGGITISNEDEPLVETPETFILKGNYPNPFNPSTTVSFDLNSASNVSIDVYSVIGQKVMTIPAQRMSAGANQSILIDASGLASGVYIYRIVARTANNTITNTGRMTLIK